MHTGRRSLGFLFVEGIQRERNDHLLSMRRSCFPFCRLVCDIAKDARRQPHHQDAITHSDRHGTFVLIELTLYVRTLVHFIPECQMDFVRAVPCHDPTFLLVAERIEQHDRVWVFQQLGKNASEFDRLNVDRIEAHPGNRHRVCGRRVCLPLDEKIMCPRHILSHK